MTDTADDETVFKAVDGLAATLKERSRDDLVTMVDGALDMGVEPFDLASAIALATLGHLKLGSPFMGMSFMMGVTS